jgi:hypothetical protein
VVKTCKTIILFSNPRVYNEWDIDNIGADGYQGGPIFAKENRMSAEQKTQQDIQEQERKQRQREQQQLEQQQQLERKQRQQDQQQIELGLEQNRKLRQQEQQEKDNQLNREQPKR